MICGEMRQGQGLGLQQKLATEAGSRMRAGAGAWDLDLEPGARSKNWKHGAQGAESRS